MIWRRNLPLRLALATSAMLGLLLLVLTGSTYFVTAMLIRRAVDSVLLTALPLQSRDTAALLAGANEFQRGAPGMRFVQLISADGHLISGSGELPVDYRALRSLEHRERAAFSSAVIDDDDWEVREGPDWWQAMTPQEGEVRVLYIPAGPPGERRVLQVGMPLGPSVEVLPEVLRVMLILSMAALLVAGWITFQMARQTYRPLREIMQTADSISTRNLAVRIPGGWRDDTLNRLTGVLNEMIGRLQEAFEAQGRFVASAAHELRSPLAAMRAELEVTLRRSRTPAEYEQALRGALEETERLTALSEHLLILARYERGAGLAMEEDLPLALLLERASAQVRRAAGAEVTVAAEQGLTLTGDSIALERMVTNLVRNGVEAGGAPVHIEAGRTADHVWITVRDHGPGIPQEEVPKLFEPFYRGDPARQRDGGVGLGLAIVKSIVDAHQGEIAVEPAEGGGTQFTVKLPAHLRPGLPDGGRDG